MKKKEEGGGGGVCGKGLFLGFEGERERCKIENLACRYL